jgi:hypothetical protein
VPGAVTAKKSKIKRQKAKIGKQLIADRLEGNQTETGEDSP